MSTFNPENDFTRTPTIEQMNGQETDENGLPTRHHSRTSPRTNAFNECLSLIDSYLVTWSEQPVPPATPAIVHVLTALRKDVEAKIGTVRNMPTGKKPGRPKKDNGPKAEGTHYVAIMQNGEAVYAKSPELRLIPENYPDFTHIYGPFRTAIGAKYAVSNNTYKEQTQVF